MNEILIPSTQVDAPRTEVPERKIGPDYFWSEGLTDAEIEELMHQPALPPELDETENPYLPLEI